jgi:transcriptional regulator with XRE-family HTH domain
MSAIKMKREEKGLSCMKLATIAKVDYRYLLSIERGRCSLSNAVASRLADALECEVTDLTKRHIPLVTECRLKLGLTVAQFADKLGISYGYASNLPNNKYISIPIALKLGELFSLEPSLFLEGKVKRSSLGSGKSKKASLESRIINNIKQKDSIVVSLNEINKITESSNNHPLLFLDSIASRLNVNYSIQNDSVFLTRV